MPAAVFLGGLPPDPHLRERVPLGNWSVPAFLSFDLALFYSRALGPFAIKIKKHFFSNVHRLMHPYLFGAAVAGWTSCHSFSAPGGAISTVFLSNFKCVGPGGPGQVVSQILSLPAGRVQPIPQEGVLRKQGSGDKPPMSARCAKALIEGGPRRFFGDFLIAQKVTSPISPVRNQ